MVYVGQIPIIVCIICWHFINVPKCTLPIVKSHGMYHEFGHLMGLNHTHACAWNGNNTASMDVIPRKAVLIRAFHKDSGKIMSHCHLTSAGGINLNLGFGTATRQCYPLRSIQCFASQLVQEVAIHANDGIQNGQMKPSPQLWRNFVFLAILLVMKALVAGPLL